MKASQRKLPMLIVSRVKMLHCVLVTGTSWYLLLFLCEDRKEGLLHQINGSHHATGGSEQNKKKKSHRFSSTLQCSSDLLQPIQSRQRCEHVSHLCRGTRRPIESRGGKTAISIGGQVEFKDAALLGLATGYATMCLRFDLI